MFASEHVLANERMHAVSGDDGVGLDDTAILEIETRAAVEMRQADELLAAMNPPRRHGGRQQGMEIAAVHEQIGCAVALFGDVAEGIIEIDVTGVPVATELMLRPEGDVAQLLLKPEGAQHFHGVRAHLNARADAGELRGLLVDVGLDPSASEDRGRR